MCTPPDIMIFTEAYKSVMSTQFQEDRFEIKKIENGENRDGIRNFSFFIKSIGIKNDLTEVVFYFKLGYKDSNLEMLESESSALPFGDSPLRVVIIK